MDAARDNNNVPTLIAASSDDGITPIRVKVTAATHAVHISDGTTGTDHGVQNAVRDQNNIPVLLAVASETITVGGIDYVQGITPVEVYANSSGYLLVDSA